MNNKVELSWLLQQIAAIQSDTEYFVSAYCGQTCYVVHRLDMETSGAVLFAKNPFILPILNRLLEDKMIQRQYWALTEGKFQTKKTVYKDKIGRDRHDRRKRVVDPRKGQSAYTTVTRLKTFEEIGRASCRERV